MAQVNAGRVRFISRGEYNNSTQYYLFDLVDYNGSSYFAKANTTGNVPTNTTYWQLVAEKGNTGGDGPVGPTGNGIASIVKTASAGLIDTYTITFTDGSTSTFNITNGADGDVTQEYVDEENERLKSVFNVLPKVSDSGESIELENTGDTILYKMDLKGNTSQEVIQGEVGLEVEDTSIYVDDVNEDKENYITLKGNTYQDGEPTPDTPQEIEVVTGLNEVKVEGKNLFNKNSGIDYGKFYTNTGEIGTDNDLFIQTIYISVNSNTQYTISGYHSDYFRICEYDKSKNFIQRNLSDNTTTSFSIITTVQTKYVRISCFNRNLSSLQFEQGTTATTYEEYTGQDYTISLGSIELCKIGTYQDRIYKNNGNWYLHKEIGKVVLNGNSQEIWSKSGATTSSSFVGAFNLILTGISNKFATGSTWLCDKFNYGSLRVDYKFNTYNGDATQGYIFFGISIPISLASDINTFRTWLGNNNLTLYYVLATPVTTEITDTTLVNQLEALYTASIHTITHINTETSNLLPYIDLKYNVVTASPSPDRASEVEVVKGNNTITISNEDGTKTQTYNLTLGNLELCKIGDYQDYFYKDNGNWYKYGVIGKKVLDGSEVWAVHGGIASWFYYDGIIDGYVLDNTQVLIKTNYYIPKAYQGVPNLVNGECSYGSSDSGITHRFVIKNTDYTQVQDFKNWLSTHNTIVYYVLATPTTTQITDQLLVSQLDELQKAMSYYDKTLITQTNASKPFILDVVGIRDLQDIFNL